VRRRRNLSSVDGVHDDVETDDAFLERVYLEVLRRPLDDDGRRTYNTALADGMSREAVVMSLLQSEEYRTKIGEPVDMQVSRDTDHDWTILAEEQPYFGVLADERFLAHNLTQESIDEFYATGTADIDHVVRTLQDIAKGDFSPARALDFGCGVGRLTLAMAAFSTEVIGVDVAEPMLDIAREHAAARSLNVQLSTELPAGPVDWINSLIVFQHIDPVRGYDVLGRLLDLLAPGGFASIQFTFYRDRRHLSELLRDLSDHRYDGRTVEVLDATANDPGSMTMYDYDMNRVLRMFFVAGVADLRVQHTDHGGCHGAWVFGRKVRL
jgi:SAM-dependent methyltransferase